MQQQTSKPARAAYSQPELRVYGNVATLTMTTLSKRQVIPDTVTLGNRTA